MFQRKKTLLLLLLLFFLFQCATHKAGALLRSGNVVNKKDAHDTIRFTLGKHLILVTVYLNNAKKPYTFILDTGAFTALDRPVAKALGIRGEAEVVGRDPAGVTQEIMFAKVKRMRIGKITVKNCGAGIFDFKNIRQSTGLEIDGILGSNFLKFFKITLDYKNKNVSFSCASGKSKARTEGHRIKFEKELMRGFAPKITFTLNGGKVVEGIIDTGANYSVAPLSLLNEETHPVMNPMVKAKGISGMGAFGYLTSSYLSRLNGFSLGSLSVPEIPVMSGSDDALLFGKDFLSQFVVTLDYLSDELILVPHKDAMFKNNILSAGIGLTLDEAGRVVVSNIWEGSPADRSAIAVGDRLLRVNGKEVKAKSLPDVHALLADDSIRTVHLELQTKTRRKHVTLVKNNLLPERNWDNWLNYIF